MKLLLISTCQENLSEKEFVHPISKILDSVQHQILHYSKCTSDTIQSFDKIIICGTSLKDNEYAENMDIFKKLFHDFTGSLLGVCSGMHIVGSIFGGNFAIDQATGGPEKRVKAKQSELQLIVREEVRSALAEMLPKSTGGVVRVDQPQDYRKEVPK